MGVSKARMNKRRGRVFPKRRPTNMANGMRHGFRSGLEEQNANVIVNAGEKLRFEDIKIPYVVPESDHTYTPDFVLENGIIAETKGKLEQRDRVKHLLIQEQWPGLDIRFVFQRPHDPIRKGSKTTYAMWCDKHNIKWSSKIIPAHWFEEAGPDVQPDEVLKK
jgi:hypothetical protein